MEARQLADLGHAIDTALTAVGDDSQLVYRCLRKVLSKKDEAWKKWSEVVDADYAKAVLCEARLMSDAAGKGSELRKMYTKVRGKYAVQELEQKVVIEVEQQNQRYFAVNEAVSLKVAVKNVAELRVSVYALNQKTTTCSTGARWEST